MAKNFLIELYYQQSKKSVFVAYIYWVFLGAFAMHKLYVKRYATWVLQCLLFIFSVAFLMAFYSYLQVNFPGESFINGLKMLVNVLFTNSQNIAIMPNYAAYFTVFLIVWIITIGWWLLDGLLIKRYVNKYNVLLAYELGLIKYKS